MNLLFVHDHKFTQLNGSYFSNGTFPSCIWSRYTSVFGHVTVAGRDGGEICDKDEGLTLSSAKGVRFELLQNTSNFKSFIFGSRKAKRTITDLIEQHDAIIARLPSRMGSLFIKEAIKQKKPFAVEVVGCPWDAFWNFGSFKGKLYAPYATMELKMALKRADFVLYVTKNYLQLKYPTTNNTVTSYCSNVEVSSVAKQVLEDRVEKIQSTNVEAEIVFGLIGNYSSKYKGIDVAIRSLAKVGLFSWRLKILGKGDPSLYAALAESLGVSKNVDFVGSLPAGKPVFDWLDSIDIYLHPSLTEGLPRALIEAMSRGCPALATNVGGIPELLCEGQMIETEDVDGLADKVKRLVRDRAKQQALAERNFFTANAYYKDVLDSRRIEFWSSFKRSVENRQLPSS